MTSTSGSRWWMGLLVTVASCTIAIQECCGQALETESARALKKGAYEMGTAFEFQRSTDGTERTVPLAIEYGVTDRLSALVEPVAYTAIRPKSSPAATGVGDLEVTAFYLFASETTSRPALAAAAETKFPTTHNDLIGTGKVDFTTYLIASKRFGRLDTHANLGYTFVGSPPGPRLANTINGALAGEFHIVEKAEVFAEVLGVTSSAPEGGGDNPSNPSSVAPEAAGGEIVGTVGAGVFPAPHLLVSLGLSYDNNHAMLLRPGVTYRLR